MLSSLKTMFQLLLKECTIEANYNNGVGIHFSEFQLLLKECTIEAAPHANVVSRNLVSVVIERMYD